MDLAFQLYRIVQRAGDWLGSTERAHEVISNTLTQLAALVFEKRTRLSSFNRTQVLTEGDKTVFTLKHMLQGNQSSQLALRRLTEEIGQPTKCLGSIASILVLLNTCPIACRRVVALIKRKIDQQLPIITTRLKSGEVRYLADVLEHHLNGATSTAPSKWMLNKQLVVVLNTKGLKQQIIDQFPTCAVIIMDLRLLKNTLGVHTRQLDRNHRAGIIADFDLTNSAGPLTALLQYRLSFTTRDR